MKIFRFISSQLSIRLRPYSQQIPLYRCTYYCKCNVAFWDSPAMCSTAPLLSILMLISMGALWEIFWQMAVYANNVALYLDVLWCAGVYGGYFLIVLQKTEGNPGLAARVEELLIGLISRGKIVMIEDNTPGSAPVFLPPSMFITLIRISLCYENSSPFFASLQKKLWTCVCITISITYTYFLKFPNQEHIGQIWVDVN